MTKGHLGQDAPLTLEQIDRDILEDSSVSVRRFTCHVCSWRDGEEWDSIDVINVGDVVALAEGSCRVEAMLAGKRIGWLRDDEIMEYGIWGLVSDPEGCGLIIPPYAVIKEMYPEFSPANLWLATVEIVAVGTFSDREKFGDLLYSEDGKTVVGHSWVPRQLQIRDGVESIAAGAFRGTDLCDIAFPDTLKSIGEEAFWCTAICKVPIPASVEELGARAFGRIVDQVRMKNPDAGEENVIYVEYDVAPENERFSVEDGYLIERKGGETILRSAFCHWLSRRDREKYSSPFDPNVICTIVVPDGVSALGTSSLFREKIYPDCPESGYRLILPETLERICPDAVCNIEIGMLNIPANAEAISDDFWQSMVPTRKKKCRKEKDYAGNNIIVFKQDKLEIEVDPNNKAVFLEDGYVCCLSSE